jgi:hypothetical protein
MPTRFAMIASVAGVEHTAAQASSENTNETNDRSREKSAGFSVWQLTHLGQLTHRQGRMRSV